MTAPRDYANQVFINCPFDGAFYPMMRAVIFAILDCGFTPRCAAEIDDSSQIRIDKIFRIIEESKYSIHDLSRTELDPNSQLPRFNMPLELGMFLGAKRFRGVNHRTKGCLIFDVEQYRYQQFISDIAGQDIKAHGNDPQTAVSCIRAWLQSVSERQSVPGGTAIWGRYQEFLTDLPDICTNADLQPDEMTFTDLTNAAGLWLEAETEEEEEGST